jgi:hypothetical protein
LISAQGVIDGHYFFKRGVVIGQTFYFVEEVDVVLASDFDRIICHAWQDLVGRSLKRITFEKTGQLIHALIDKVFATLGNKCVPFNRVRLIKRIFVQIYQSLYCGSHDIDSRRLCGGLSIDYGVVKLTKQAHQHGGDNYGKD